MEISAQTLGDVRILKAIGAYGDVLTPLSAAILRMLAEEPGAVAGDLSAVVWGSGPNGEEGPSSLAQLGECVRSWPGTPVLMACPDARVRAALQRRLGGTHVVFTSGMAAALEGALGGSRRVERLALWPLHSAPGTARALAASNDATAVADNALNAADNAVNSAGNAVENASDAVENATTNH